MDHRDASAVLDRLDRLAATLDRRLTRIEERLRLLDRDAGDMVALLTAIRACLDQTLADVGDDRAAAAPGPFLN